jgi:hypothetical protein
MTAMTQAATLARGIRRRAELWSRDGQLALATAAADIPVLSSIATPLVGCDRQKMNGLPASPSGSSYMPWPDLPGESRPRRLNVQHVS